MSIDGENEEQDDFLTGNIFTDEFCKISRGKDKISLNDVLKISILDENGDLKISLCHIHSDKDGSFTLSDFSRLSKISEEKEKQYKRFEFSAQLQAFFTLRMWKQVCSEEGEKEFISWIKKLIINSSENEIGVHNNTNHNESDEESINPDPNRYVDRRDLRLLYDVLNVKTTHGIDFQSFFELMKITSDEMEDESLRNEEFVLITVLDYFCINFIRGFSKLILDLGFESFMESEFE